MAPIILSETVGHDPPTCPHTPHLPRYDAFACRWLSVAQVREQFPRFDGTCTACGKKVIIYASLEHFRAGDWR